MTDTAPAVPRHGFDAFQKAEIETRASPFPYFVAGAVLDPLIAGELLSMLEKHTDWRLHETGFFSQDEWNLTDEIASGRRELLTPADVQQLRRSVEVLFECALDDRVKIIAHRLQPGQEIGIHNDAPCGGDETHRFVVHLGRDFEDAHGGHLVFFDPLSSSCIHRIFRPLHNTGVGFAMSEFSYHAVSKVREGVRYSLVFSFWMPLEADTSSREPRDLITVARGALSDDTQVLNRVFAAFPRKYPTMVAKTDVCCTVKLNDSVTPGMRRDPVLDATLRSFTGLTAGGTQNYRILRRRSDGRTTLRCLDHNWALWAWSKWLAANSTQRPILIVHLDSHDDLGTPPITLTPCPTRFALPFAPDTLDLAEPKTVSAAIRAGRIGIGSFIVPFLHAVKRCDFHHVWHTDTPAVDHAIIALEGTRCPELTGSVQPSARLCRPGEQPAGARIVGRYERSELEGVADLCAEGPVLLDIDMDFFCNRWAAEEGSNPGASDSLDEICALIDRLGELLCHNRALVERIVVATVAVSPGFFPAEHWSVTVPLVEETLDRVFTAIVPRTC